MPEKSRVAIVRCDTYDEAAVFAAVERGVNLLGGMGQFIHPDERIVLKPNVLAGDVPEKLVSPHPAVFKAVARLAQAVTPNLTYGDSPGFGSPAGHMRKPGFAQAAAELGIPLGDFVGGREVSFEASPFIKRFALCNGVLDSDGLISIAKFKAHQLTRLTGAVKNQFGCVPGLQKPEFHVKLPNPLDFSKMLVCLNLYIRPRLFVLDGVMAMQGNGPRGGSPFPLNVLLFSTDPVALDATMCRLVALDPEHLPTNGFGREWGLGTWRDEEIELVGDALEPLVRRDFDVKRAPVLAGSGSRAMPVVRNLVSAQPVIDAQRCTQCGTCVRVCPVPGKAVNWRDGDQARPPEYHYDKCIRCFCCQELCPERAISVRMPLLGRLLRRG